MGFEVPAAMGAQVAAPNDTVWSICGDGGFMMTLQELATIAEYDWPIKFAIINNGNLGMVRQWQELFYRNNTVATPLKNPDFVKLAEAFGILGLRAERKDDVQPVIETAMSPPRPRRRRLPREVRRELLPDGPARRLAGRDDRPAARSGPSGEEPREGRCGQMSNGASKIRPHTIIALVEDRPGVLNRIASKWRQRSFNIESLAVGHSEKPGLSRMTFVVDADANAEQVVKQLDKLIDVVNIRDVSHEDIVAREMAMIKVKADTAAPQRHHRHRRGLQGRGRRRRARRHDHRGDRRRAQDRQPRRAPAGLRDHRARAHRPRRHAARRRGIAPSRRRRRALRARARSTHVVVNAPTADNRFDMSRGHQPVAPASCLCFTPRPLMVRFSHHERRYRTSNKELS